MNTPIGTGRSRQFWTENFEPEERLERKWTNVSYQSASCADDAQDHKRPEEELAESRLSSSYLDVRMNRGFLEADLEGAESC